MLDVAIGDTGMCIYVVKTMEALWDFFPLLPDILCMNI